MNSQSQPKNKLKKRLIITGSILIALTALFFIFVVNISGSTQPILKTANKLKVPDDWTLTEEHIEPPRFYCLTSGCPSVYRSWLLEESLDKPAFSHLIESSNMNLSMSDSCFSQNQKADGLIPICSANGQDMGFPISLTYWASDQSNQDPKVVLIVGK